MRLHQLGDQGELVLIAVDLHDRRPRPTCPTPLPQQRHHSVGVYVGLAGLVDGDGSGWTKVSEF